MSTNDGIRNWRDDSGTEWNVVDDDEANSRVGDFIHISD